MYIHIRTYMYIYISYKGCLIKQIVFKTFQCQTDKDPKKF